MNTNKNGMIIVVIGPMGCGKTTIGKYLAKELAWPFYDADDYHPEANKKKMEHGIPLDDHDRYPWLTILHDLIQEHISERRNMILACSALKETYRDSLGIDQKEVFSVFLKGSFSLLKKRLSSRSHEFMAKDLLQSQLDTLEEPKTGLTVDITGSVKEISNEITLRLLK